MDETEALLGVNPKALLEIAHQRASEYREADPFPHIVIDNFLPERVVRPLIDEFPDRNAVAWRQYDTKRELKLAVEDESLIPAPHVQLLRELNSQAFVNFLEVLTDIPGLVPDPHLRGAGLHQIPPGGFFKVHVDFNLHPRTGLEKRVNVLLYLNEDWHDSYHGDLELWNPSMTAPVRLIAPIANRLVIFSSSDQNHHGHPAPLACPPDRSRRALVAYFYGTRANDPKPREHTTEFKSRPGERVYSRTETLKRRVLDASPRPAREWARRVLNR